MAIRGRQYPRLRQWIWLFMSVTMSAWWFSGCAAPAPDHSLSGGETSVDQGSPTATAGAPNAIAPINVISAQTSISGYPGGYMTLTISTSPSALCSFTVDYGSGKSSKASGIVPFTANEHGIANWRWQIDPGAHTGTWPLHISAFLPSGAKTSATVTVTVALAPIGVVGSQTNLAAQPGGSMMLAIVTAPSVDCKLALNYGVPRPIRYLGGRSNSAGFVLWNWRIPKDLPPGTLTLSVTATLLDGEQSSASMNMTVL